MDAKRKHPNGRLTDMQPYSRSWSIWSRSRAVKSTPMSVSSLLALMQKGHLVKENLGEKNILTSSAWPMCVLSPNSTPIQLRLEDVAWELRLQDVALPGISPASRCQCWPSYIKTLLSLI